MNNLKESLVWVVRGVRSSEIENFKSLPDSIVLVFSMKSVIVTVTVPLSLMDLIFYLALIGASTPTVIAPSGGAT